MKKFGISLYHLVLITFLLMIIKIAITAFCNYYYAQKVTMNRVDLQLETIMHARYTLLMVEANSVELNIQTNKLIYSYKMHEHFTVTVSKKQPANTYNIPDLRSFVNENDVKKLRVKFYENRHIAITTYFPSVDRWITFTASYKNISGWLVPTIILLIGMLILLAIWFLFFFYYRKSIPEEILKFLTRKNRQSKSTNKTIRELTHKIENIFEEKNIMLTALSHDIKTPLTEAMLQLELMEKPELAESIKEKLITINNIINTSLDYSKEPGSITKIEADIRSLIDSVADNYRHFGYKVELISDEDSYDWPIEMALFKRLVVNIIDNAKKYSTYCKVTIQKNEEGALELTFTDNGEGVPKSKLKKLSTPYFRVDQSRSRDTGGTGLGLAIVKKIAQMHNGEVHFSNADPHGFCVSITLHPNQDHIE